MFALKTWIKNLIHANRLVIWQPSFSSMDLRFPAEKMFSRLLEVNESTTSINKENNAIQISCYLNFTGNISIALLFLGLPFHIFIMKIIAINLRFANPRHIILFCLSISDSLQVAVTAIIIVIKKAIESEDGTQICMSLASIIIFNISLTYIVSSLTLVALSIERYIACFHSFRIQEWLTNKRIIVTLIIFWVLGIIGGGFACIPDSKETKQVVLANSRYFGEIFIAVTLPVSLILIIIQTKLFRLSRKKLNRIRPCSVSTSNSGEVYIRRSQIKGAFVSSIIVLSYLICVLPGAGMIIINRYGDGPRGSHLTKLFVITLGMLNTLLNPFIYGFGMMDTRKAMVRELKMMQTFFLTNLGLRED